MTSTVHRTKTTKETKSENTTTKIEVPNPFVPENLKTPTTPTTPATWTEKEKKECRNTLPKDSISNLYIPFKRTCESNSRRPRAWCGATGATGAATACRRRSNYLRIGSDHRGRTSGPRRPHRIAARWARVGGCRAARWHVCAHDERVARTRRAMP